MDVKMRYLRPRAVVGVEANGPYAQSMEAAWQQVFSWLTTRDLWGQVKGGIGMRVGDPRMHAPGQLVYRAGVDLGSATRPDPLYGSTVFNVVGGVYAAHAYEGAIEGTSATLSALLRSFLPQQGLVIDDQRPLVELYDVPDFSADPVIHRIEFCIPVTPQS
ncbi:MAG: GyrI-like domain-containing protein [Pseudomonadota bacterium]